MSSDLIEKAKELGRQLAQAPEFQALEAARREVENRAAAKLMYEDFGKKQAELEGRRAKGQPIPDEQMKAFEAAGNLLMNHGPTRNLLMAEFAFVQLMNEVQRALGGEVGIAVPELPGAEEGQ